MLGAIVVFWGASMQFEIPASWLAGHSLKSHLYLIITFLGLLPILGVVLAFATFEDARRDHQVLDRAAHGTIHLEHINRLVDLPDFFGPRLA